jgi:hypothetical protein
MAAPAAAGGWASGTSVVPTLLPEVAGGFSSPIATGLDGSMMLSDAGKQMVQNVGRGMKTFGEQYGKQQGGGQPQQQQKMAQAAGAFAQQPRQYSATAGGPRPSKWWEVG